MKIQTQTKTNTNTSTNKDKYKYKHKRRKEISKSRWEKGEARHYVQLQSAGEQSKSSGQERDESR